MPYRYANFKGKRLKATADEGNWWVDEQGVHVQGLEGGGGVLVGADNDPRAGRCAAGCRAWVLAGLDGGTRHWEGVGERNRRQGIFETTLTPVVQPAAVQAVPCARVLR